MECLGDDTTLPVSQHFTFSPDRYETTRSLQIPGGIAVIDWLPEEMNWSWLRDVPTGFRGEHRGTSGDVDIPFSLTPL